MSLFRFFHPVEIRYADIDAQRHVNNAHYFTFMEQARVKYVEQLGLWTEGDFDGIGFILAEQSCTYKTPIAYGMRIQVGVRVDRIGNKSFEMAYSIQNADTEQELATGRSILVAYDYPGRQSVPLPDSWRSALEEFERSN